MYDAEVADGVRLEALPSHVALFDELMLGEPRVARALRRRGFVESQRFFHELRLVWHAPEPRADESEEEAMRRWWRWRPTLEMRWLLLLTRAA